RQPLPSLNALDRKRSGFLVERLLGSPCGLAISEVQNGEPAARDLHDNLDRPRLGWRAVCHPSTRFDLALDIDAGTLPHAAFDNVHERTVHNDPMRDGLRSALIGCFVEPLFRGRKDKDRLSHAYLTLRHVTLGCAANVSDEHRLVQSSCSHCSHSFSIRLNLPSPSFIPAPDETGVAVRRHRTARLRLARNPTRGRHPSV